MSFTSLPFSRPPRDSRVDPKIPLCKQRLEPQPLALNILARPFLPVDRHDHRGHRRTEFAERAHGLEAAETATRSAGGRVFLESTRFDRTAAGGRSGAFAVSLIYVSYAYAGWNAATYITGEIDAPTRNLPRILALGAAVVTILYVALNAAFMAAAPASALAGKVEVGVIAARAIFGADAGNVIGVVMASLLISTVSAMTIAGPRVLQAIGEDFPVFRSLAAVNRDAIPARAIHAQAAIAILFIVTSSFQSILVFAGFLTALNSFIAVLGLFVLRFRRPALERPFRTPLFPLTPLIYLAVTGWTLVYAAIARPVEVAFAAALIAAGLAVYAATCRAAP